MLLIAAIVQPFRLEHIRSELLSSGIVGMTVCECCGHGQHPKMVPSRFFECDVVQLVDKVKIEVLVRSYDRDIAIQAITRGARLNEIGDGKIFVTPIERIISIRTGAENELAIYGSDDWLSAAE